MGAKWPDRPDGMVELKRVEIPVRPAVICSNKAISCPDMDQTADILAFHDNGVTQHHEQIAVTASPLVGTQL
jgi:hypothetical protein